MLSPKQTYLRCKLDAHRRKRDAQNAYLESNLVIVPQQDGNFVTSACYPPRPLGIATPTSQDSKPIGALQSVRVGRTAMRNN